MNQELIDKFYQGKCTPGEVQQVLAWFKENKPGTVQKEELLAFWQQADQYQADDAHKQEAHQRWLKLEQVLHSKRQEEATGEAVVRSIAPAVWKRALQIAAVLLLLLGTAGVWVYRASHTSEIAMQMVTTGAAPGMKKTIHLEDGSIVYLSGGSSVTYPVHFASDKRDISLKGEAFFEVAKDKQRPFTVLSGTISTQALGTSFNISSHAHDGTVAVALATGKVKIAHHEPRGQSSKALAVLSPGQQLVYNKAEKTHRVETFSLREVLGWKDGVLIFKKASLQQVIGKLENWYGVKIELEDKDLNKGISWNYTGEYDNQSLDQVLEGIGFVKHFSFERQQDTVRIKFTQL